MLAGDFNARVGNSIQPWVSELSPGIPAQLQNTDGAVSANGLKLLHMCEDTAMVLCTGRVPSDTPAQASFKARSNTQPSRLDHVLVDAELFHALETCKVGPVRAESDHLPLELCLMLAACPQSEAPAPASPLLPAWKWDGGLQDTYAHAVQSEPCQLMLAESMAQAHAHQHEQASSVLHSVLNTAAQAAGLRRKQPCLSSTRPLSLYPCFDSRCAALRTQFRQTQRLFPESPSLVK